MKYVYKLEHSHISGYLGNEKLFDTKIIGYSSSRRKAEETMERYKDITGFKDYPDGFIIEKIEIDFNDFKFI